MNQWYFVSENFTNGYSELKKTSETSSNDRLFKDAQKLSITAEKAWVKNSFDKLFNKDNDIIIASKYQIGAKRIVDKIHYLKQNYPEKTPIGPFFHPTVYATKDFKESSESIVIQIRVYDEDGLSKKEIDSIHTTLSSVGTASVIAFPAFAPIAGLATGVGKSLVSLVDSLNNHDKIIDGTIKLEVNKPNNQGYDHLQPGFLICFDKDIVSNDLYMSENKMIYTKDENGTYHQFQNNSYIVLRVRRSFVESPDYEADEHAATLLTEINGKQDKPIEALSFVRDTFDSYTKFKKLKRVKELKEKDALTTDEQELLDELLGDNSISDFIN